MPIFGIIDQYGIAIDSIKSFKKPDNGTLVTFGLAKDEAKTSYF